MNLNVEPRLNGKFISLNVYNSHNIGYNIIISNVFNIELIYSLSLEIFMPEGTSVGSDINFCLLVMIFFITFSPTQVGIYSTAVAISVCMCCHAYN